MTNKGGYQNLIVYQLAVVIYDLNAVFCQRYLADHGHGTPTRRTVDQMIQAARSGKQNIVEGSLEKSLKMNIKLTAVARASLGELLEDFKDFLRTGGFSIWDKNDPRVLQIRTLIRNTNWSNWTNLTNSTNLTRWTKDPQSFSNLMITMISLDNYLLDKMVNSLEQKFITEGGYSENLFKRRLTRRNK